jgi:hypothetical protein
VLPAQRHLELAAADTAADVAAQGAPAQRRAGERRELEPDLSARGVSRVPRGDQRVARLKYERADLGGVHIEHLGDLGVTERLELRQHESGALWLGQLAEVGHERAQFLAALDLLGKALHAPGLHCMLLRGTLTPRPQSARGRSLAHAS